MFLLLTLNVFHTSVSVFIVEFEQVNVNRESIFFSPCKYEFRLSCLLKNLSDCVSAENYFFKVLSKNTTSLCVLYSKATIQPK